MTATTESNGNSPIAVASALSLSRALLTAAKKTKKAYWQTEILAAVLAVGGAFLPMPALAIIASVLSITAKAIGKFAILSDSKKLFRLGERARRYDFYERTLGWPVPPADRADMVITQSSTAIRAAAAKLAASETDYYSHKGAPSTERLLCNLGESMFWTERLMGEMAKVRWKHVAVAVTALVLGLVGTVLIQPGKEGLIIIKVTGLMVSLLVALDILGEARSFKRGESDTRRLFDAVLAEMRQFPLSVNGAMRLMAEYNCLLADLPLLPDSIYEARKAVLNEAWTVCEKSLPIRCSQAAK